MNSSGPTGDGNASERRSPEEVLQDAFSRYQDELLGTLFYLVGNVEDARDTLQEAFLKCWRRRDSVADIQNLRAWIFRITLNAGRDLRATAWRRRSRPMGEDETMLPSKQPAPEAVAVRDEQLALVKRALLALRPEEQEVFLLRQNGQMTYEQIAGAINIPLGTVKTRMRLALGKLREALEGK